MRLSSTSATQVTTVLVFFCIGCMRNSMRAQPFSENGRNAKACSAEVRAPVSILALMLGMPNSCNPTHSRQPRVSKLFDSRIASPRVPKNDQCNPRPVAPAENLTVELLHAAGFMSCGCSLLCTFWHAVTDPPRTVWEQKVADPKALYLATINKTN